MNENGWRAAARDLRRWIDEAAEVPWSHPAWWGLVYGSALLATYGARPAAEAGKQLFFSANGHPDSDTFMARDRPAASDSASGDPAALAARAVQRARLAVEALAVLDGSLPQQPLRQALGWRSGWLEGVPLTAAEAATPAFVTPRGVVRARLAGGESAAVAAALARHLAGRLPEPPLMKVDSRSPQPLRAAVAVGVLPQGLGPARHVHRQSWTAGGGPWLGVVDAPGYELVTTCHVRVDGYGHSLVSARIFAGEDGGQDERERLGTAARAGLDPADALVSPAVTDPVVALDPVEEGSDEGLGFCGRLLEEPLGRFRHQVYAFGKALSRVYGAEVDGPGTPPGALFSPTFHVPIAPGEPGEADRRLRRILTGLLALRQENGRPEGFEEFSARLGPWLERERRGDGALSLLTGAMIGARLPAPFKRRLLLARRRPVRWLPSVAVLAGRGRFSSLRFAEAGEPPPPLYAASVPALRAFPHDPAGSLTLTLVHHREGCSAALYGTGLTGKASGAEAFVEVWVEELRRVLSAR